jgi:two-component system cell cycle response regulator
MTAPMMTKHKATPGRPKDAARTILIADDDPVSSRILEKSATEWGYRVVKVPSGPGAWAALQKRAIRIAVLDWMMPGLDGPEICRRARAQIRGRYVYIILLTSKSLTRDIIAGIRSGADDYMTKPVNLPELQARLQAGRRIIELEDSLRATQKRLTVLATRDSLTGLWNRAAILRFLKEELEHGRRQSSPTGVIMLDLDHFKQINDLRGHQAGDAILKAAARRLQSGVRPYDRVGRYGGDEFLVVLPNCGLLEVAKVAERLRVSAASRKRGGAKAGPITFSLGCTSSVCFAEPGVDGMILTVDEALYASKRGGRNRVSLADAVERRLRGGRTGKKDHGR